MSLSGDKAQQLFRLGRYSELLRQTQYSVGTAFLFPSETRSLLTEALCWTGDYAGAASIATHDATEGAALTRSRAEAVLGIVRENTGRLVDAAKHYQTAVRLALDTRNTEAEAWARLYQFRFLTEIESLDNIRVILPTVRQAVTRAGCAQISAYLHTCVSALEGRSGRMEEALRHCRIAEELLDIDPNVRIASTIALNRACIATLSCDFRAALSYLDAARPLIIESGHARSVWTADSNLARIATSNGKWQRSEITLQNMLRLPTGQPNWRLGTLDELARLQLAKGDSAACAETIGQFDLELASYPELENLYHVRWAFVTRVRHLIRQGQAQDAIRWLTDSRQRLLRMGDKPLEIAFNLSLAHAFAAVDDEIAASTHLLKAHELGVLKLRELQAHYYYISALVNRNPSPELARLLRKRASEIWKYQGDRSTILEIDGSRDTVNIRSDRQETCASPEVVINSLASFLDLAHSPKLLAQELEQILTAFDCPATVIRAKGIAVPRSTDSNRVFQLGKDRDSALFLSYQAPESPAGAIVLADILRIAHAAIELDRLNREERNRAALWPADPIETEAGALFLAEEMQTLLTTVRRIAPSNVPVLITGETGTGKEVVARLVHAYSNRAKQAFLPFNCTATPKDMLDSQLFGHRRGAFTGAIDSFPGVIRTAAGGTLFLDEIGETTLDVQPKLLRFLESGEIHPIGDTHPAKVDVRIVAATNADLDALVTQGRFREDLFYRLNIVRLHIPPLRERRVEIPALANHYLHKYAVESGKGDLRLAEETMEYLVLYRWPGNVRQLANEMRRLTALAEAGAVLMPEHLSAEIASSRKTIPASERTLESNELVVRLDQPMVAATQHLERAQILWAMRQTKGGLEETSRLLGISRKGLYLKRLRYGLDDQSDPPAAVA